MLRKDFSLQTIPARGRAPHGPVVSAVVLSQTDDQTTGVRYAYSIDGRSYQSKRERVFTARFLKNPVRKYTAGDRISVFVDPGNHKFAVVEPGGAGAAFIFFSILSGIAIFFGVGGVVWALGQSAAYEKLKMRPASF